MIGWVQRLAREIEGLFILGKMAFGWRPKGPEDIDEEFWGDCPQCGGRDRFLNVGSAHWFACHRHRIKWYGGEDVFAWRHQTKEDWVSNARLLSHYRETTEPFYRNEQETLRAKVTEVCDVPARQVAIESGTPLLDGPPLVCMADGGQTKVEPD